MDDAHPSTSPGSTVERLLAATREEIAESGFSGATSRAIAERAGVNEVTLFRRFGTKAALVEAALRGAIANVTTSLAPPGDDIVEDLAPVAAGFAAFVDAHPGLVARVLAEMASDSPLMKTVRPIQRGLFDHLVAVLAHHRDAGRLAADLEPAVAARAFMGPLAARAIMAGLVASEPFDASAHVHRFLHGWAATDTPLAHPTTREATR